MLLRRYSPAILRRFVLCKLKVGCRRPGDPDMDYALVAQEANYQEDQTVGLGCRPLREMRERLGLSLRDVQTATEKLAAKYQNPAFVVHKARLSDYESKGILPNIYRLYALGAVYGRDISELFGIYGIAVRRLGEDSTEFRCRPHCGPGRRVSAGASEEQLSSVEPHSFGLSALRALAMQWGLSRQC